MSEFSHQKTIDLWHEDLLKLVEGWKNKKPPQWKIEEINPS